MLIILEGFDTTGKSNLANYLAYSLEFYYRHSMPNYSLQLYQEFIETLDKINENVIIDRFHLTDLVYGKIVCDHVRMNDEQIHQVEQCLLEKKTVFIHCTAKIEIVEKRYEHEKNKYVPQNLINHCLKEYERQFGRLRKKGFPVYQLDTSQPIEYQKLYVDKLILDIKELNANGTYGYQ